MCMPQIGPGSSEPTRRDGAAQTNQHAGMMQLRRTTRLGICSRINPLTCKCKFWQHKEIQLLGIRAVKNIVSSGDVVVHIPQLWRKLQAPNSHDCMSLRSVACRAASFPTTQALKRRDSCSSRSKKQNKQTFERKWAKRRARRKQI